MSCSNGLPPIDGKCQSCGQYHTGCSENCTEIKCNSCLGAFILKDGKCDVTGAPNPVFKLIGYGRFNKRTDVNKISFMIYFKIIFGFMHDSKISFILSNTRENDGFLQKKSINGIGTQIDTALGAFSDSKKKIEFLVKFVCEIEDVNYDHYYIYGLKLLQFNNVSIDASDNFLYVDNYWLDKNIDNYTTNEQEELYDKSGNFYTFVPNKARRGLEITACKISRKKAEFTIDGISEREKDGIGKTYKITTSDENIAYCTLIKENNNSNEAKLNCEVINLSKDGKGFTLKEEDSPATDGSGDVLSFTYKNPEEDKTLLCKNEESNVNRKQYKFSGARGLSVGAIVGIVLVCLVIAAIILFNLLHLRKKGGSNHIVFSHESSCSQTTFNKN